MADLMESRCGSLPTAQLAPHAEQFLSLLERKGIVPDQEITNEKARSADKALRKNMYHNTRLMLQHYRDIAWALECFPARVAEELDRPLHNLDALLTAVDAQLAMQNNRLEHRLECVKKSRLLMDRINEANHFGQIHTLDDGDTITFTTKLGKRSYEVFYVGKILETDFSRLGRSSENMITLITCVRNQPELRWCVQAREVS